LAARDRAGCQGDGPSAVRPGWCGRTLRSSPRSSPERGPRRLGPGPGPGSLRGRTFVWQLSRGVISSKAATTTLRRPRCQQALMPS
jgi:hypothetical protein